MSDSFPRQYARTQRFTLGEPRNVSVSPDGERVVFLRSSAGDDPVNALWVLDVGTGEERLVADPRTLLGLDDPAAGDLTDEERRAARADSGRIDRHHLVCDRRRVPGHGVRAQRPTVHGRSAQRPGAPAGRRRPGPRSSTRPDRLTTRLRERVDVAGRRTRRIVTSARRQRPEGHRRRVVGQRRLRRRRGDAPLPRLLVEPGRTVDRRLPRRRRAPVAEWTIADPADPSRPARTVRYPAAGTDNPARHAARARARRVTSRRRLGPRVLPLRRARRVDRRRAADVGAVARPAGVDGDEGRHEHR